MEWESFKSCLQIETVDREKSAIFSICIIIDDFN